ncbi:hypothetical protein NIES4071_67140 [Calothrix sp. NIES-4071]|nr:hypothetical protein NIES4071_67140 [Calothrix sp. NIES-4071]BAZ60992.1 hypothetical protein NIES4105_67100 [Calothrix sp. NIES-4105]
MKTVLPDRQKTIVQWVSQATGINTLGVKVRLQGNDLHILCEAVECPSRWQTLSDLLKALQQTDLEALKSNDNNEQPSIYQVFVYGRKKALKRPEWCHRVFLNQLDRHIEQVDARLLQEVGSQTAIIVSNESLAKKGDLEAIARYLSETLSGFGIGVRVKAKNLGQDNQNRLWVLCKSSYAPDPSLIAETVAQKLRYLKLVDYQDAVIVSHVQGEQKPDWMLRIDLTPTDVMLKDWARWGDVQAIAMYLNEKLVDKIKVTVSLQESTLHVFCTPTETQDTKAPRRGLCMKEVGAILNNIAPQGIVAATVYGQVNTDVEPAWIDWLSLPAKEYPALLIPAIELGSLGDEPAIVFLLERLLNPDLDWRLKTGGTRVLLLRKGDLMHVMCDAPVCPNRKQVATSVIKLLRQLKIPHTSGVRVYGRRAGNKEASWHYGVDLVPRQRYVPEPPPEFAATSTYVRELLPPPDEPVLRQDLTSEEVQTFVKQVVQNWGTTARKLLLATQLFQDKDNPQATQHKAQLRLVALVWGTVGLLLTLQTDWVLNQVSRQPIPTASTSQNPQTPNQDKDKEASASFTADTTLKANQKDNQTFNASAFTQTTGNEINPKESGTATAILLAARTQSPSFNARQLDEQLALYRQRLQKNNGKPPDILIIGSSRALRGIDPVALSKALATQSYRNLDVFNFGINGATAQVVNFILRKVLEPQELPKLIIWADGARAFNSGREDTTFRSIAASPGYKQAIEKSIARGDTDSTQASLPKANSNDQQQNSYQAANDWLNERLGYLSGAYQNREQLKALFGTKLDALTGVDKNKVSKSNTGNPNEAEETVQSVDFDGFLPLSTRFDPNVYYQKHPKVSGSYDNDYKGFLLGGDQDLALQEILKFTQSQKISLVFVNMPLTSEYLDPARTQFEQLFQQYMIQTASERSHFVFRDLGVLFPQNNDFFSDPSHLNRYGAYEVSNKLAKDPMIPWTNKK